MWVKIALALTHGRPHLGGMAKLFARPIKTNGAAEAPLDTAAIEAAARDIDDRARMLEQRRVANTMQIIELEKAGELKSGRQPVADEVGVRISELLGEDYPGAPRSQLADLRIDNEAIDAALIVLRRRGVAAHGAVVEQRSNERMPAWRDLVRRRALAVAELRRLNLETDVFSAALASGGQRPAMGCEYPTSKLLGSSERMGSMSAGGTNAREFLAMAVKAGLVTEKEIN